MAVAESTMAPTTNAIAGQYEQHMFGGRLVAPVGYFDFAGIMTLSHHHTYRFAQRSDSLLTSWRRHRADTLSASEAEETPTKIAAAIRAVTFRRLKNSTISRLKYPIT